MIEVSCNTCVGACCRADTLMPLTPAEATYMRQRGTKLKNILEGIIAVEKTNQSTGEVEHVDVSTLAFTEKANMYALLGSSPDILKDHPTVSAHFNNAADYADIGKDFYRLESDCGNLDPVTYMCDDYENRPEVCREFAVGSAACERFRNREGVPVQFTPT